MTRKRQKKVSTQSSSPLLDIVIVTGGRFDMLRKCLKALENQEGAPAFQVFIIDNATDNKERLYNKDVFESPVITESRRLTQEEGFPRANNDGARMGTSPLILFLNDDVELKPDAIREMVTTLDDSSIGIVGAKLLFPDGSRSGPAGKVQHVGLAITVSGEVIHPLIGWSADNPKCCVSRDVIGVTGACLMVRRSLFKQAGGFWEGYGAGTYEDCDLCLGVLYLGKRVVINANAQGTHYTGATVEKKQRGFPLHQNALFFKARWTQTGIFRWSEVDFW